MDQKKNNFDHKKRLEIEQLVYTIFDKVDPTHTNTDYYQKFFSKMSDQDFYKFISRRLPFRFHQEAFKVEPKMPDIIDAFKILNKPLIEKLNMPHVYINADGIPVKSQDCLVIYIHLKRMKQMLSKKNNVAMDTDQRDMRTGLLQKQSKGGKETDREFEALASYGLDYTMDEFRTVKADAMRASAEMMSTILDKGSVSEKDYNVSIEDSLARNMLNVYLIGANIHSNLIDANYYTPHTLDNRKRKIDRV